MLKSGQIALAGKVKGLWNKDTRSFEVKRGVSSSGNKYQIFEISVSSKNQDGSYTNGKGVKVMLSGETKVEHNSIVGVMGFLSPDNYTKDDKEIQGFKVSAKCEDMFEPIEWAKKEATTTKKVVKDEDVW